MQNRAPAENLSRDGFRLTAGAMLHCSQRITMRLARRAIGCEVRWVEAGAAGGLFSRKAKRPQW